MLGLFNCIKFMDYVWALFFTESVESIFKALVFIPLRFPIFLSLVYAALVWGWLWISICCIFNVKYVCMNVYVWLNVQFIFWFRSRRFYLSSLPLASPFFLGGPQCENKTA